MSELAASSADIPPQSLEAEESILGAMLISPKAIDAVIDVLEPRGAIKFYRESHGRIYQAALALHSHGLPVDAITLTDALERTAPTNMDRERFANMLDAVGGRVRLHELAALVPATANVAHYARIVHEAWLLRSVIRIGGEIAKLGWERAGDTDTIMLDAESLLMDLRGQMEQRREETMTMYEAAEYLDAKFRDPPEEGFGIPTPWSWLPSMHGGRLYVLGAYEKDGKTVQAAHFFLNAIAHDIRTEFWTLEMSKVDMAERLAANRGLPAKRVQSGRLEDEQRALAAKIVGDFARYGKSGLIVDAPSADVATIRRQVGLRRPQFIIVDHLHQFSVRPEYERQDLEHIVRELWRIAREFDIPVLLLAQLSRSGDRKNPYPRPTAAQLRGSGMIEKVAWAVWFVWRERDERNLATEKSEFIIALNRSGTTGVRYLTFHDRETRFTEVVREG